MTTQYSQLKKLIPEWPTIKQKGYCPGVGIIGDKIVYVENRNRNSDAQTYQDKTLNRMFKLLKSEGVNIDVFRADSASYTN